MPFAELLPSGHWRAGWRDHAGRRRTTSRNEHGQPITKRREALRIASDMETRQLRGERVAAGPTPTWGDWCPLWLESRTVEPSTADANAHRVRKYLEPRWGAVKLARIGRSDVQAWVTALSHAGLAPATVEAVFRLFQASMTAAARDGLVPVNPCAGVRLPPVAPGHERFLTRSEVDAIGECLNHPYRLAVLIAAGTGLRWGELAGLHWQRVDLTAGMVDVVETWDPTAGRVKAYPKGKLRRAVPVPSWLLAGLVEARDVTAPARVCGQLHAAGAARCRSGLVVPGPAGAPLNGRNFGRRQWRDACDQAGVDDGVRLHDLRHTYASWLVQGGLPLQEVQRLLGHASSRTTERYSHLGTSQHERVLAVLG